MLHRIPAGAAQENLDLGNEQGRADGLDHALIHAGLVCLEHVGFGIDRREQQDRGRRFLEHLGADLEHVGLVLGHVDHDQVGRVHLQHLDRLVSGARQQRAHVQLTQDDPPEISR